MTPTLQLQPPPPPLLLLLLLLLLDAHGAACSCTIALAIDIDLEAGDPMAWISPTERIVIVACIVDAADKALLPATLRSLQHALGAGPAALGMLSFYQNIAYSLALPLWGLALAHGHDAADLLALGCVGFGMVTVALALSSSYALHCALRCLNGAFLCGIVPLGQAILVQIVAEDARGRAFGRLQAASALASLLTFAFCTSSSSTAWRSSYIAIGVASMGVGWFVRCSMPRCSAGAAQHVVGLSTSRKEGTLQRARSSARKILQIPSFVLLVLQGITGGVPWNAMNFLPLYWLTIGYSDSDAGLLGAAVQAGFIAGSLVGGRVGDAWAKKSSDYGRAFTAQLSVSLGIPAFAAIFFLVPREPGNFGLAAFALFVFGSVATWVGVAANRPICADLVSTPAEQGQIVALWVRFLLLVPLACSLACS